MRLYYMYRYLNIECIVHVFSRNLSPLYYRTFLDDELIEKLKLIGKRRSHWMQREWLLLDIMSGDKFGFRISVFQLIRVVHFKGSSDPSHFIFEIIVGKGRIRHRTTLKLNIWIDPNRLNMASFKFRVVLCRNRLFRTLISKRKLLPLCTTLNAASGEIEIGSP